MEIDVWDTKTLASDLLGELLLHKEAITSYFARERELSQFSQNADHRWIPGSNPFSDGFLGALETLSELMVGKTLRSWHYTRLTDYEVRRIETDGIELSTLETLRRRLDTLVEHNDIARNTADSVFDHSPLHSNQFEARTGLFWATSHPIATDDSGVARLTQYWGGEVAHFHQEDEAILSLLERIGKKRVLEIAMPMVDKYKAHSAARSIISAFSQASGEEGDFEGFDISTSQALEATAVLRVHTEGEESFENMGLLLPNA